MRYLRALHQQHRGPLIVVLDRLNAHRSAVRRLREYGADWLTVEWLLAADERKSLVTNAGSRSFCDRGRRSDAVFRDTL